MGDKVTYKSKDECNHSDGEYYYGGDDQGGFVGEILDYVSYDGEMECWEILVASSDSDFDFEYNMLESEFLEYEYDKQPSNELFPIY